MSGSIQHPEQAPEHAKLAQEWSNIPIIAALPAALHPAEGGEEVLLRLADAKIIRIGAPAAGCIEGGGLVLDYVLHGSAVQHRLIFAFNELGMWIIWDSFREAENGFVSNRAISPDEVKTLMQDQL